LALATTVLFLTVDVSFFVANAVKIPDGGYVPLALAALIFVVVITWRRGRQILGEAIRKRNLSLGDIISNQIDTYPIVEGTALYMSGYAGSAPPALVSNVKYNKCRHETIILLTVQVTAESHVPHEHRFEVMAMPKNFYQVILRYGFMDQLNLMDDLSYLPEYDIPVDITDATFILGNETLSVRDGKGMARWRKHVFKFLHRNSRTPVSFFGIPVKKVLEVGSHIEI
jgi:KUP system potassium uptake protein